MIEVSGHDKVRLVLENSLPPVTLLKGPAGIGKWTLAEHLVDYYGLLAVDVRKIEKLSLSKIGEVGEDVQSNVRQLIQFSRTAPMGSHKLVIARLDGASIQALNALLKVLEEPPSTISFILIAEGPVLNTVASRSQIFRMGLLSKDKAIQNDNSRVIVLSILKAIKDNDRDLLEQAVVKFDESKEGRSLAQATMDLLNLWLIEAISGRWKVFTDAETFGLASDSKLVLRMFHDFRLNARPKFMIHGVLDSLIAGR